MTHATSESTNLELPLGSDDDCLTRLRPMFRIADMAPSFPMQSAEVNELARANGFDTSVELIEGWARSGMVPGCRIRAGQFAWLPTNVLTALVQADTWRRWIPLHPLHIHKLTALELEEARASAAGSTVFEDLGVFDVTAFIEILCRTDDPKMREMFAIAMKSKLRSINPEILDK